MDWLTFLLIVGGMGVAYIVVNFGPAIWEKIPKGKTSAVVLGIISKPDRHETLDCIDRLLLVCPDDLVDKLKEVGTGILMRGNVS